MPLTRPSHPVNTPSEGPGRLLQTSKDAFDLAELEMKTMADAKKSAPKKGGKMKKLLLLLIVALIMSGAGAAVPMFLSASGGHGAGAEHESKGGEHTALVPFGEAVVNLYEERLTRYISVKVVLLVDEKQEKAATELLTKKKAIMKHWLISHLSDKSLKDVSGAAGVNRLRREVLEHFNDLMYPDGSEKIKDILFEEFVVQ